MSELYAQLLGAAVEHLDAMRAAGQRFVNVSPEALAALAAAPRLPVRAAPPEPERPQPQAPLVVQDAVRVATASDAAPAQVVTAPSLADKVKAVAEIRERALQCVLCPHLASTRKNVVFGVGDVNAEIMFVGEAPGADEDIQGEPFVGAAGLLLTKMITAMGLTRQQVYIANILKCRPHMPVGASGNRKPTGDEMRTCIPYLHAQIDIIKPKALIGLGATAVEGLLGKTAVGITKLRGSWQTFRGIPLMPTYHPAYLLRNQAISEKRRVWEDLLAVMEQVGLPISEKQRGFFLRA